MHRKLLHQKHQRTANDEKLLINPLMEDCKGHHDPTPVRPGGDPLRRELRPIDRLYNPVDDGIEPMKK